MQAISIARLSESLPSRRRSPPTPAACLLSRKAIETVCTQSKAEAYNLPREQFGLAWGEGERTWKTHRLRLRINCLQILAELINNLPQCRCLRSWCGYIGGRGKEASNNNITPGECEIFKKPFLAFHSLTMQTICRGPEGGKREMAKGMKQTGRFMSATRTHHNDAKKCFPLHSTYAFCCTF